MAIIDNVPVDNENSESNASKSKTRCEILNVDDEDLDREVKQIMSWMK